MTKADPQPDGRVQGGAGWGRGEVRQIWFAWAVHGYTASGAVMAFLAARAAYGADTRTAFLWLFAAVAVDATDGWLARRARVSEHLPQFSGRTLDDLVDYLTYVFVPALIFDRAALLPPTWGLMVIAGILLSSAYGFANDDAKTDDHFFTGFPSYWNIVAVYLVVARFEPVTNALILLGLAGLVFVRIGYIYPTRTSQWQALTLALGSVWSGLLLWMIVALPSPPAGVVGASLVFPVYYVVLSLVLDVQRRRVRRRSEP